MKRNTEFKHPELKEGEYYWGNCFEKDFESIGWKIKRRGEVAYDIWDKVSPYQSELCPVFVSLSEWQEYLDGMDEEDKRREALIERDIQKVKAGIPL